MGSKKNVLLCLPHFQNNHISYYTNLMDDIFNEDEVTVIAYTFNRDFIKKSQKTPTYFPKKGDTVGYFLLKNIGLFRKADIIIFEELYKLSPVSVAFIMVFGKKIVLTIHNVNKWFKRGNSKTFKQKITTFIITQITKKVKGIITVSLSLKKYIEEEKLFNKAVYYIPFTKINNQKKHAKNVGEDIIFTIPGTINSDRRDYKFVLEVFYELLEKQPLKIKLFLLGKLVKLSEYEVALILKINQIQPNTVTYWESFVSDEEFDEVLKKTNYLIGNIKLQYTENRILEEYGKSKETGILFLMLNYQIPGLFPEGYFSHEIYKELIIYYQENKSSFKEIVSILSKREEEIPPFLNFEKHENLIREEINNLNNAFV
ncbi:MAG: hypothetical protein R2781_00805 [Flavobacteriaceae bacterium]